MGADAGHMDAAIALARLRAEFEPLDSDPDATSEACEACGVVFWRYKGRKRHHCPSCAAARMVAAGDGQRDKAGPAYERAVRGQLAYWDAEARRLGIVLSDTLRLT